MKFQDLLDHFDDRPEIRERIIKNTAENWPEKSNIYQNDHYKELAKVLLYAFSWHRDGDPDFWDEIYNELLKLKTND